MDDELQALLTITIPIVPNSQTDGDSSMPNECFKFKMLEILSLTN